MAETDFIKLFESLTPDPIFSAVLKCVQYERADQVTPEEKAEIEKHQRLFQASSPSAPQFNAAFDWAALAALAAYRRGFLDAAALVRSFNTNK